MIFKINVVEVGTEVRVYLGLLAEIRHEVEIKIEVYFGV